MSSGTISFPNSFPGADDDLPALSSEQLAILTCVLNGNNVFYTGGAGTGKSLLLREIVRCLRVKYPKSQDAVAVTSPTGTSASSIGGTTIHSFAGIGMALESAEVLSHKIKCNVKAMGRWHKVKVLVIDEVSMLEASLFDKLARIACIIRKCETPFGGVQVVVTGDFFQLPPVAKNSSVRFAFEAKSWSSVITHTFRLDKIYRQRDSDFARMLNEVRFGNLTASSVAVFRSLSRPLQPVDGVEPTELFPRRQDVDRANNFRLAQLSTPILTFDCVDGGSVQDPVQRDRLLSAVMAPKVLTLRLGAQVMLVRNMDQDLVNGTVGCVIGFQGAPLDDHVAIPLVDDSPVVYPLVAFRLSGGRVRDVLLFPQTFKVELPSGEVRASRFQVPLILAWAISIHKAQGQTLDLVKVDLKKVFERGQVYVALSRATSLEGLQVLNFESSLVQCHPRVNSWSATLSRS